MFSRMVELTPMTAAEYAAFCERAIPEYAAEKVLAGSWTLEESLQKSHESYTEILPDGPATRNQFLYTIRDAQTQENIGVIWLADDSATLPKSGFIYELSIIASHRRRGYATQAMREIETKALALGLETLGLHVFGQNRIAIQLYEKLGYAVTDINMAKTLS